jgi:hypothetical protein
MIRKPSWFRCLQQVLLLAIPATSPGCCMQLQLAAAAVMEISWLSEFPRPWDCPNAFERMPGRALNVRPFQGHGPLMYLQISAIC